MRSMWKKIYGKRCRSISTVLGSFFLKLMIFFAASIFGNTLQSKVLSPVSPSPSFPPSSPSSPRPPCPTGGAGRGENAEGKARRFPLPSFADGSGGFLQPIIKLIKIKNN